MAVFKTQTFYCSKKMLFWHIWHLSKELDITLSKQIEMNWLLILNAFTWNFLQIWVKKIIFHLLETPLKIAQIFVQVRVLAKNFNFQHSETLNLTIFIRMTTYMATFTSYMASKFKIISSKIIINQNNIIKDHNKHTLTYYMP